MESTNSGVEKYNIYRDAVAGCITRSQGLFKDLGQKTTAESLETIGEGLISEVFRILVMGEFNQGKSTFINALLGEKILPSHAIPTTAVINIVKWGEERKAVINFKFPLPLLGTNLSEDVRRHIAKFRGERVGPLQVPYTELESYVVIPDDLESYSEEPPESPFHNVELYYPSDLLRDGIEIVDSPGLNEHDARNEVTMSYLFRTTAIIFLFDANKLALRSELNLIRRNINDDGLDELFMIVNKFDDVEEEDRDAIRKRAYQQLADLTNKKEEGIFFVSAREALRGKTRSSNEILEESGFPEMEKSLYDFLATRGYSKIRQAIGVTKAKLADVSGLVNRKLQALEQSLEVINEAYEKVQPILKDAEEKQKYTVTSVNNARMDLRQFIRDQAHTVLHEIAQMIPDWTEELELENKIKLLSLSNKETANLMSDEVNKKLGVKITESLDAWRTTALQPEIERFGERMSKLISTGAYDLATTLSLISETFSGIELTDEERQLEEAPIGHRLISGLGAILIGDIPLAAHGVRFGFKGFGKALLTQLGIGAGLAILGVVNPFIFLAAAFSGGFLNSMMRNNKINDDFKRNIGLQVQEKFKESISEQAQKISNGIFEKTQHIPDTVNRLFEEEISAKREEVQSALNAKRSGESEVERQKAKVEAQFGEQKEILRELKIVEAEII